MNDIDFQANKDLLSESESNHNSYTLAAKVTTCLCSHDRCTGRYIDFSSKYVIICHCRCHKIKEQIDNEIIATRLDSKNDKIDSFDRPVESIESENHLSIGHSKK